MLEGSSKHGDRASEEERKREGVPFPGELRGGPVPPVTSGRRPAVGRDGRGRVGVVPAASR